MKLIIATTIRRNSIVVEDVFCQAHWDEAKKLSPWQSDELYSVKTVEIVSDDYTCRVCDEIYLSSL